jgi:hypothetical protein
MNEVMCRLESVSTEIAVVVICIIGAVVLKIESKDLLMTALGGLLGYLTRKATS